MAGKRKSSSNEKKTNAPGKAHAKSERPSTEGVISVAFPVSTNARKDSQQIHWEEFFEQFDDDELMFIYQGTASGDQQNTLNKLLHREHASSPQTNFSSRNALPPPGSRGTARKTEPAGLEYYEDDLQDDFIDQNEEEKEDL